jgi:hypothetical protein
MGGRPLNRFSGDTIRRAKAGRGNELAVVPRESPAANLRDNRALEP